MYHNIFDNDRYKASSCKDNVFAQFLLEKGLYDTMEITEENISVYHVSTHGFLC